MLAALPLMLGAWSNDQVGGCTDSAAPTAESVPAMLLDSGTVEKLDLTDPLRSG